MRERGVNRVIVGVWDLDAAMALYSDLLQTRFTEAIGGQAADFGVRASINLDAGVELVAPLPDRPSRLRAILEARGEGVIGTVYAVPDADAARDVAARHGIGTSYTLDYDQATIDDRYGPDRFVRFYEHFLDASDQLGPMTIVGEFDRPQD